MWFQKISITIPQMVTGHSKEVGVGKYEAKLEFLEGWGWGGGSNQKNAHDVGIDIFWNHTTTY